MAYIKQALNKQKVLVKGSTGTIGTSSQLVFNSILAEFDPTQVLTPDGVYVATFHTLQEFAWKPEDEEPDLTVPDLADSIEAMLARRASGVPAPTTIAQARGFLGPVDPATQKTATDFLKQVVEENKRELKETAQTYKEQKAKAKADAEAKAQEAKEFAAFKKAQKEG